MKSRITFCIFQAFLGKKQSVVKVYRVRIKNYHAGDTYLSLLNTQKFGSTICYYHVTYVFHIASLTKCQSD